MDVAVQPPQLDGDTAYRVEDLAGAAGVSVDTIRFYQGRGLLPRPRRQGRIAWYGAGHLDRLIRIRELADSGFSLAQIAELLAEDPPDVDPLLAALAADDGACVTLDELARRTGLSHRLVATVVDAGLVSPVDGDRFDEAAIEMLEAAAALLQAGIPLEVLGGLALRHAERVEATVAEALEVFRSHVGERLEGDRTQLADLTSALVPAVTALVAQHFSRTLVRHARALVDPEPSDA